MHMRLHNCEGTMSDQDVGMWWIGMCRHGRSARASKSHNMKRKIVTYIVEIHFRVSYLV